MKCHCSKNSELTVFHGFFAHVSLNYSEIQTVKYSEFTVSSHCSCLLGLGRYSCMYRSNKPRFLLEEYKQKNMESLPLYLKQIETNYQTRFCRLSFMSYNQNYLDEHEIGLYNVEKNKHILRENCLLCILFWQEPRRTFKFCAYSNH